MANYNKWAHLQIFKSVRQFFDSLLLLSPSVARKLFIFPPSSHSSTQVTRCCCQQLGQMEDFCNCWIHAAQRVRSFIHTFGKWKYCAQMLHMYVLANWKKCVLGTRMQGLGFCNLYLYWQAKYSIILLYIIEHNLAFQNKCVEAQKIVSSRQ